MATAVRLDTLVNLIPAQYYIGKTAQEELEFVRSEQATTHARISESLVMCIT